MALPFTPQRLIINSRSTRLLNCQENPITSRIFRADTRKHASGLLSYHERFRSNGRALRKTSGCLGLIPGSIRQIAERKKLRIFMELKPWDEVADCLVVVTRGNLGRLADPKFSLIECLIENYQSALAVVVKEKFNANRAELTAQMGELRRKADEIQAALDASPVVSEPAGEGIAVSTAGSIILATLRKAA